MSYFYAAASAGGGGGGPPAFVSQNTGSSTSASPTATLGSTAAAGNLIILVVSSDDYNTTPPTGFTESTGCGREGFLGHYLWWKVAAGGETSVGYTIGSAVISVWAALIYSGMHASPYDVSNGNNVDSSGSTYTTPSITPSSGSRLLIATVACMDGSGDLSNLGTWLNSFTERSDITVAGGGVSESTGVAELVVTASGAGYSSGATYSAGATNNARAAIIIAFKGA